MAFEQRRDKAITVWKLNRKESEHSLENTSPHTGRQCAILSRFSGR
ncbi:Uncharacterised protein [Serratia marcescens]|nr:hypothetical protein SME23J_32630 [Serratia marcescens]CUZ03556.1 Uncharacterised protein [Serratia marcescens]